MADMVTFQDLKSQQNSGLKTQYVAAFQYKVTTLSITL